MTIYFYKVGDPYGCFSNFSPHPIDLKGQQWLTSEHYYQAHKFVGTSNEFLVATIQAQKTPEEAAALGRDPRFTLRRDWAQVKTRIMWEAVQAKFLTHLDIQAILLSTGDQEIVEDSPTDPYWGCGRDRRGQNQLGKILMQIRQEIRAAKPHLHLPS